MISKRTVDLAIQRLAIIAILAAAIFFLFRPEAVEPFFKPWL